MTVVVDVVDGLDGEIDDTGGMTGASVGMGAFVGFGYSFQD